ncbi:hypothetical protein D3C83_204740 [compost metagenome]
MAEGAEVYQPPCDLHFVVAGRGSALSAADVSRLRGAPVGLHLLPDAGHWLHIDALAELVELVAADLPSVG